MERFPSGDAPFFSYYFRDCTLGVLSHQVDVTPFVGPGLIRVGDPGDLTPNRQLNNLVGLHN